MLSERQNLILGSFMEAATRILPKLYKPDSCIATTRIAIDVLERFHFKVRPLTVEVSIYNPAYTAKERHPDTPAEDEAWKSEGCWAVVLGDESLGGTGHLAALVNEDSLIDLTLPQANRPHKQIVLPPVVVTNFPAGFPAGLENDISVINGCTVVYRARPAWHYYLRSKDWTHQRRLEPARKIEHWMRGDLAVLNGKGTVRR